MSDIELEKLEKVKQIQISTFAKVLPIVLAGNIAETFLPNKKSEEERRELNEIEFKEILAQELHVTPEELGTKKIQKEEDKLIIYNSNNSIEKVVNIENAENKIIIISKNKEDSKEEKHYVSKEVQEKLEQIKQVPLKVDTLLKDSEKENHQSLSKEEQTITYDRNGLPNTITLEQLKSKKIITEYEKKLKDVRSDLRKLIFEYNVLVEDSHELYESKEAEELLIKLNLIIKKIEELQNRINIEDIDKYDDNYIYTLIEDYIEEFKNKKFVDEIKDSELYILISEKLEELDDKKDNLNQKVEVRKDKLAIDERNFEDLKEKFYNYDNFNKMLNDFQKEQDYLLDSIKEKMKTATSIEEKVETQVKVLNAQSRRLMNLLALQMLLPGVRGAKRFATTTALYMNFMRNILNPKVEVRRYKVIHVKDYSKEIESSISAIDDISTLLNKTSNQLTKMIKNFKKEYEEYFGVIKECDELLKNLEKVHDDLEEKEYEIAQMKKEQEKNLEKNNAKVKKLNNYRTAI